MKRYAYVGVGIVILIVIRAHCLWAGQWGTSALMVIIERENSSVVVLGFAQNSWTEAYRDE